MKECNYFDYNEMVNKLFYGVALTDEHMNAATEKLRKYIVDGGYAKVLDKLGVGIKTVEKQFFLSELNQLIKKRFVWLKGERKGEELTVNEIISIGMFLKCGAFQNMYSE